MKDKSIVERMKPFQEINNKKQAILDFFGSLEFNVEEHKYSAKGKDLKSVSATIGGYVEPFDADRIAGYVAKSRGISKAAVLKEWDDKRIAACNKGNRVHDFGENHGNVLIGDSYSKVNPIDGYEKAVINFWDSIPDHIEPFLFELKMYSLDTGIAGTADIILYNTKTGKFILADYKTNIDLFKNHRGKKMLPPFDNMLDMPFSKYELQLSFYQELFEQSGFEIEARKIIWLKPDGSYKNYNTKDYTKEIKNARQWN